MTVKGLFKPIPTYSFESQVPIGNSDSENFKSPEELAEPFPCMTSHNSLS